MEVIFWLKTFQSLKNLRCLTYTKEKLPMKFEVKISQMKTVKNIISSYDRNNNSRLILCLRSSTNWAYLVLTLKNGKLT